MAQLFGASWMCLLLAGVWSLACGYWLRRTWTAEADEANATRLASARNETIRLRTDVESRNTRVRSLEADLAKLRSRDTEVDVTQAAELEAMALKLTTFEAKAAGFDLARVTSLKTVAERDRAIADMHARLQSAEAALAEANARNGHGAAASAKANADLVDARRAWGIERSTLVDEHALKLGALDRSRGETAQSRSSEVAALITKVAALTAFQTQAQELGAQLESTRATLWARDNAVAALEKRLQALEPLPAQLASAQDELSHLHARLQQAQAPKEEVRATREQTGAAGKLRDDLKVIEGIGPKIEMLLNEAGYLSFGDVARADPNALTLILEKAGPRFALARTETWPEQAQLLAEGKMDAFKTLTDELKGGVRR